MEFLQFKVTIRRAASHCDSLSNYFSMFHPWILSSMNESIVRRKGLIIRMKLSFLILIQDATVRIGKNSMLA